MAKRLSPVTIITLLKKAKKVYQKEAPNPKDEVEKRHRKIDEDLKTLRRFARREETGADLENVFEVRKVQCFKKLKVQYQKLKGAKDKDPNKARLPKYLVALGKLTLSVKRLEYKTLSDEEEDNLDPDALEDEDLGEMDVAETEEEAPATNGQAAVPADAEAEYKAKLAEAMPAIKAAATGPNAAALGKLLAQATALSKPGGDMAQALAKLTECHDLAVNGAEATTEATEQAQGPTAAALMKSFNELSPRIKQAMQDHPGHKQNLLQQAAAFQAVLKANRLPEAEEALDDLISTLDGLKLVEGAGAPASEPAPARADKPKFVNYAQARLAWVATRQKAGAELEQLKKAILADYQGDPLLPNVQKGVRRLDTILKTLDESLADKLDEALNADEVKRPQFNQQAAAIIARYQQFLKTSSVVIGLDANPFRPVRVEHLLSATLTTLAAKLV
jgi:hypothetical protein